MIAKLVGRTVESHRIITRISVARSMKVRKSGPVKKTRTFVMFDRRKNTTVMCSHLGDIMPGVFLKPTFPAEELERMQSCIKAIMGHQYTPSLGVFTKVNYELWEVPWATLFEQHIRNGKQHEPLCIIVNTPREWAEQNRIPYNNKRDDVQEVLFDL